MKQELLKGLEEGTMDLFTFTTYTHLYNVEYKCILDTPVYELTIDGKNGYNVCSKINEIYKNMTCKNLNSGRLTFDELQEVFSKIYVDVKFE